MMKLALNQIEITRNAALFVVDERLATIASIEDAIGVSAGWLSRFLNRNGLGIDDPGYKRLAKLHNYIVDNYSSAFNGNQKEAA